MKDIKIKICGVTSSKIAKHALLHGAHYIGIVFHPQSLRFIQNIEHAKKISLTTKKHGGKPVGIFVNQNAKEINSICKETGIEIAQIHGQTVKQNMKHLSGNIIKILAISVNPEGHYDLNDSEIQFLNNKRDFLLFDYQTPGSGICYNHIHFQYQGKFKFFIAGGLNKHTIHRCLSTINPYAVDVSSGVEMLPGVKCKYLIQQFIEGVNHV